MTSTADYNLPPLASWRMRIALAAAIGTSYWIISHELYRSRRLVEEKGVLAASVENRFAVQQEKTTPRTALGFFLVGGTGLACLALRPLGRPKRLHIITVLGLLFFGWCCLSILWSFSPEQSLRKLTILGLMLLGAFGMAHQLEMEDVCWVAVLMLGGYLGVGYLMEFYLGTFRPWEGGYRFAGTVHPNDQGVLSSLLVLAAMAAPWHTTRRPWIRNVVIAAALPAAWLSGSRTAVAAMIAAIGMTVLLRQRGLNRALAITAVAVCISVGLIGFGFLQASAAHATADAAAMGRADEVSSLSGRLPLWDALLHDVQKKPLVGHGYGGYWTAKNMRDLSKRLGWHIPHAHNGFIELMLAGGVVLLCLYLLWIVTAAATSLVRFQRSNRPADLFLACFVAFSLVNNVAESKFPESSIYTQIMFTGMAAMALRKTVPRDLRRRSASIERPWRLPQRAALPAA